VKALFRSQAVQSLLTNAIVAYERLLIATITWKFDNREVVEETVASPSGAIVLFWHGRIGAAIACVKVLHNKPRRVMISLSRDGAFISSAAVRLGVPVIRGSTAKGLLVDAKSGGAAFREAVESLRAGELMLLTPDGPRGPREVISMGSVRIAAAAAVPVLLAGFAAEPSLRTKSWDRARIPLPFAKGRVVVAGPLTVPATATQKDLENIRADWQRRLREAQDRADARPSPASPSLKLYRLAARAASPLLPALLACRAIAGKEDATRRDERLGRPSRTRPAGRLVWLHGASIGESLCLLPLIEALAVAAPDHVLLATSGTKASAELLARRLPPSAIHQYAPLDTPSAVGGFMAHWRPSLAVFAESELWPNQLFCAKAHGAKLALVSARISAKSYARWRKVPAAARTVLADFDLILARDEQQADLFRRLGGRVDAVADLKFAARPLPCDEGELVRLSELIGDRAIVLAASTHSGEEAMIFRSWAAAGRDHRARSLLVIAPRHASRGPEVRRDAIRAGLRAGLRSERSPIDTLDVYVADTVGELGLLYRLCVVAFIGNSLIWNGAGHNPLEPARLGCPFLCGPHFHDWPIFRQLQDRGATRFVANGDELVAAAAQGLDCPQTLAPMADKARRFVLEHEFEARAGIAMVVGLLDR